MTGRQTTADRPAPDLLSDLLTALTWRNRRGDERNLKYVVNGRLERSISLQGVYRLTDESAARLGALLDNAPTPTRTAWTLPAPRSLRPAPGQP